MTNLADVSADMLRDNSTWGGEMLCVKKYPRGDEKTGTMGYSAFGVVAKAQCPVVVYIRPDFVQTMTYDSVADFLEAGWVVD